MKKMIFVCTIAVLMCSACKWFGDKPNNDTDQQVVVDSLQLNQDSTLTETPDSTVKGSKPPGAEKEVSATKPSGN